MKTATEVLYRNQMFFDEFEIKPEVYVAMDLYRAGQDECGNDFIAELFFVAIAFADGSQIRHQSEMAGAERWSDDDGIKHFADVRKEARAAAYYLANRVLATGVINTEHWGMYRDSYELSCMGEQA